TRGGWRALARMGRAAPACNVMNRTSASGGAVLLIAAAIDIEFKTAAGLLSEKSFSEESRMKMCRGSFSGRRVTILQSGMGAPGFAERLADHLKNNRYDAMIIAGLAGGLDPQLSVGDAVLYNLCYDARAIDFTRRERPDHEEVAAIAGDGQLSKQLSGA